MSKAPYSIRAYEHQTGCFEADDADHGFYVVDADGVQVSGIMSEQDASTTAKQWNEDAQTKKVFSIAKYRADRLANGKTQEYVDQMVAAWAGECEGLTEDGMLAMCVMTDDDWMIEKAEVKSDARHN